MIMTATEKNDFEFVTPLFLRAATAPPPTPSEQKDDNTTIQLFLLYTVTARNTPRGYARHRRLLFT